VTNQTPTPSTPATGIEVFTEPNAAEVREAIEQASLEAQEVAQASAKVDLQFPAIGFINPVEELEKMRRIVGAMPEQEKIAFPEKIRAKLIASHADSANPQVTDEELALAIYIKRTTDSALTEEELQAKATGKAVKKAKEPKEPKAAKETKKSLDDLLG